MIRDAPSAPVGYLVQIGQWGTNVASGAVYDLPIDLGGDGGLGLRLVGLGVFADDIGDVVKVIFDVCELDRDDILIA